MALTAPSVYLSVIEGLGLRPRKKSARTSAIKNSNSRYNFETYMGRNQNLSIEQLLKDFTINQSDFDSFFNFYNDDYKNMVMRYTRL